MIEDSRNHDPAPTDTERAWMETNPLPAVMRLAVLILIAFSLGGYMAAVFEQPARPGSVAEAAK